MSAFWRQHLRSHISVRKWETKWQRKTVTGELADTPTRGYTNSRIANLWTRQRVDWTSHGWRRRRLYDLWIPPAVVVLVVITWICGHKTVCWCDISICEHTTHVAVSLNTDEASFLTSILYTYRMAPYVFSPSENITRYDVCRSTDQIHRHSLSRAVSAHCAIIHTE